MTHGAGLKHALYTAGCRRHEDKFDITATSSSPHFNSAGSRGLGGCAMAQPYNFVIFCNNDVNVLLTSVRLFRCAGMSAAKVVVGGEVVSLRRKG